MVGFRNEPAYEDQINAVDVFVQRTADGSGLIGAGDRVELAVEVQLRRDDAIDAEVLDSALLATPRLAFGTEDRYNAWFRPTADGAYGFHVTGVIQDVSNGGEEIEVDETFVCRGGSQNPEGRSFGCVEDPQSFPRLRVEERTGHDTSSYRDTDIFSLE